MKTAHKTIPQEKTSLQMSKWIKASPAKVFGAWSKAELMSQWFTPDMQKITPLVEADFRVGGTYSIRMKRPENSHMVSGKYLEIVPDKKISFTWVWEGKGGSCSEELPEPIKVDSIVTVEFKEKNGGTDVVLTHERLPDEEQVKRHTEGWTGCLGTLAGFVEK